MWRTRSHKIVIGMLIVNDAIHGGCEGANGSISQVVVGGLECIVVGDNDNILLAFDVDGVKDEKLSVGEEVEDPIQIPEEEGYEVE